MNFTKIMSQFAWPFLPVVEERYSLRLPEHTNHISAKRLVKGLAVRDPIIQVFINFSILGWGTLLGCTLLPEALDSL